MKIIQSCGSLSWGGLEMITLNTSSKLSELGHDVTVLCSPGSKLEKESAELNLRIEPLLRKKLNVISSIGKLKNILNKSEYDIIHTHLSNDLWIIVPAVKLSSNSKKIKLFLTKHMASSVNKRDIPHRILYKRLNKIFAVSNFIKESVTETCPVKAEDVVVIPDTVSLKLYNPSLYEKKLLKKS
ncbi:MAG: glycosyltransferase family 4 protein [Ignavibacteria bacterium]